MSARRRTRAARSGPAARPCYELRVKRPAPGELRMEVWQVPSAATPHLSEPRRVAGLHGRNLALVEHRVLRHLASEGVRPGSVAAAGTGRFALSEAAALRLALLFRVLAPMRSRSNMLQCAQGIEAMGEQEAAYWLGMALHRPRPRRVLKALRTLLTAPQ